MEQPELQNQEPQQSPDSEISQVEPPSSQPSGAVAQPRSALAVKNGSAIPSSVEEQFRLAKMYISSRVIPDRFKTPESVVAAMHYAAEHFPDSPLTALRQIAVINGTPCFFGDLPLAMVQRSRSFAGKKEFFIDKEGNEICLGNKNLAAPVWAAVCITKRNTYGGCDEHTTVFSFDDAMIAGLMGKGVWKFYPKRMLMMRSRSQNLKDNFADCLNGIGIAEYDTDSPPKRVLIASRKTASDKFNEDYLSDVNETKDVVQ